MEMLSTSAQYVTLDNKIKCLSLYIYIYIYGKTTNKTVTRTANMWELLIATHLDQSLWSTNQKYWATVRSNWLHSFLEVHNCVVPFTSHGKLNEFGAEKSISWAKPVHFDFFKINFTVLSHILSTGGDALGCIYISIARCVLETCKSDQRRETQNFKIECSD